MSEQRRCPSGAPVVGQFEIWAARLGRRTRDDGPCLHEQASGNQNRRRVVASLVEGNSIRATVRMTGVAAFESAFGVEIDYAMPNTVYRANPEGQTRYSPAKCIGVSSNTISGDLDPKHVSTSYVERQNLTMRMSMRRFTRLTNAFSKKLENHAAMVALYFMYYNFGRVHQTLR
jgi:hypothetical protein